ncbi:unnamed protein product, partial [Durusdinium trenchii]
DHVLSNLNVIRMDLQRLLRRRPNLLRRHPHLRRDGADGAEVAEDLTMILLAAALADQTALLRSVHLQSLHPRSLLHEL